MLSSKIGTIALCESSTTRSDMPPTSSDTSSSAMTRESFVGFVGPTRSSYASDGVSSDDSAIIVSSSAKRPPVVLSEGSRAIDDSRPAT